MIKKIGYFIFGILLIPLAISSWIRFPALFTNFDGHGNSAVYLFFGMVLYLLFEIIFDRPLRTYVFGHECTHAIASVLMGGQVGSFEVSKNGGSVSLSKTNFFVALAPYCVPLYTLLILVLYYVLNYWWPLEKVYTVFLLAVGFTFAFHVSLTIFAARQGQPDLKKTGFFFSLIFILLVNSWVLTLISKMLFWNSVSVRAYGAEVFKMQFTLWRWTYHYCTIAVNWIRASHLLNLL